jgi:hypothetical protein
MLLDLAEPAELSVRLPIRRQGERSGRSTGTAGSLLLPRLGWGGIGEEPADFTRRWYIHWDGRMVPEEGSSDSAGIELLIDERDGVWLLEESGSAVHRTGSLLVVLMPKAR